MIIQPRIVAIIQARMSSTRLPGKILQEIAGQPMLVRVVERARQAHSLHQVVVATTSDPTDDPVEALCQQRGYPCYRGSLQDVLDRYYQASRLFQAGVIVRLTADCPLIDPGLIDQTVCALLGISPDCLEGKSLSILDYPFDFAANRLPPPWRRTFPIGLDTEACTFEALERAWKQADQPHQREHVMPFLYEPVRARYFTSLEERRQARDLTPENTCVIVLNHDPDYGSLRWTVDTPQDLELVRQVYARFEGRERISWLDVLELFQREPQLSLINAEIKHRDYRETETKKKA